MRIPDAIVLAGGRGTRLGKLTDDIPKPMLPLGGRPFLEYVLAYLCDSNVARAVLSVGYQRERIRAHFGDAFLGMPLAYSEEDVPLGTGGAVLQALPLIGGDHALIINGDTYFPVDISLLLKAHLDSEADVTIALKSMEDTGRYGRVIVEAGRITGFLEKGISDHGLINGGTYLIRCAALRAEARRSPFSLERDILENSLTRWRICGVEFDAPFVDIGVPEDYLITAPEILS